MFTYTRFHLNPLEVTQSDAATQTTKVFKRLYGGNIDKRTSGWTIFPRPWAYALIHIVCFELNKDTVWILINSDEKFASDCYIEYLLVYRYFYITFTPKATQSQCAQSYDYEPLLLMLRNLLFHYEKSPIRSGLQGALDCLINVTSQYWNAERVMSVSSSSFRGSWNERSFSVQCRLYARALLKICIFFENLTTTICIF